MDKLTFSQLWVEEEKCLFDIAGQLTDDSVIVDIGTAQGGSSFLFAKGAEGKRIEIYSYDIAPSGEAYKNLENTGVKIIAQSSFEGASAWTSTCGKQVNCLFIDGSHTFLNVSRDIQAWVPFLSENAILILHDYDPPEKGGFPHLGVKITVDSYLNMEIFNIQKHVGRLLILEIEDKQRMSIMSDEIYFNQWEKIGRHIKDILENKFRKCIIIGSRSKTVNILLNLLNVEVLSFTDFRELDNNSSENVLFFERPFQQATKDFFNKHQSQREVIHLLDDLTIYYLLFWAMSSHRDEVLAHVGDRGIYFKHEEQLEMLDHCLGGLTIETIFDCKRMKDSVALSAVIGGEIVRTGFLSEIKKSIDQAHEGTIIG